MNTDESEFEDALETARALLSGNDDAGDLWEANDLVNHALRLRPHDTEAWILKCQVLSALEDDAAALAAIEMAARRAPRRADVHYWRAAVLGDLQRFDDALAAVDAGFRWLDQDEDWLLEDLYYEKAALLDAVGRRDDALRAYEDGLERCPDSNLLRAGIEPLRRATARQRFTVLEGGRR
jgi:tetratricopeptide (TPR) repeat protein